LIPVYDVDFKKLRNPTLLVKLKVSLHENTPDQSTLKKHIIFDTLLSINHDTHRTKT
jgi:hypothetical protein